MSWKRYRRAERLIDNYARIMGLVPGYATPEQIVKFNELRENTIFTGRRHLLLEVQRQLDAMGQ